MGFLKTAQGFCVPLDAHAPADGVHHLNGTGAASAASKPNTPTSPSALNGNGAHVAPPARKRRAARDGLAPAEVAEIDAALLAYNEAAAQHGFALCRAFTPARQQRLARRLTDIGGIDAPQVRAVSLVTIRNWLAAKPAIGSVASGCV